MYNNSNKPAKSKQPKTLRSSQVLPDEDIFWYNTTQDEREARDAVEVRLKTDTYDYWQERDAYFE